jgi:hypothetical protein
MAEKEGTSEAQAAARDARKQADETYGAAHGESSKAANFIASPELKKLFKEVLKRVHPDRATGEADRTLRERLMKDTHTRVLYRYLKRENKGSPRLVRALARQAGSIIRQVRAVYLQVPLLPETPD